MRRSPAIPAFVFMATVLGLPWEAWAHDFWIEPSVHQVEPDQPVELTLLAGHQAERQRSEIPRRRITRFESIGPDGVRTDLLPRFRSQPHTDGVVSGGRSGVHVIVLETDDAAQSHLPAERFNAYLLREGLTLAMEHRRRGGRTGRDGHERYGRRAKTLVQVGRSTPVNGAHSNVTTPHGLDLEIVPEVDPHASPAGARFPVRVYFHGSPLSGALVRLTDRNDPAAPSEVRWTDAQGRATFDLSQRGAWLVSTVWSTPLPESSPLDFHTIFTSLTFGFPDETAAPSYVSGNRQGFERGLPANHRCGFNASALSLSDR